MVSSTSKLFKGTYAWHVTSNLLHLILGIDAKSKTSFEVSEVDFFICHSWSCPAILKALAVCHQLNLNLAIETSIFAFLLATFTFVLCGGPSHVSPYSAWMKWFPIIVFMTTYLFGHFINKKTVWFDRISVDQGNLLLKSQTISEIPTFIARSSTLMVLWDDTLFARLWCNFELAVRAKVAPYNTIQIVPLWIPVWTLILFCVQTCMCFVGVPPLPRPGETESPLSTVVSFVETWTQPLYMYFLFALINSSLSFEKLKRHKWMLDRMASFDIRNAKCALETDRIVIEEQVFRLFDEALEPAVSVDLDDLGTDPGPGDGETPFVPLISPDTLRDIRHITSYPTKDEVMDQFNGYVQGPLRNMALSATGPPGHISIKIFLVAILPWQSLVTCKVLTCEGHSNCEAYVSEIGYSSVAHYMATNAVMALFLDNFAAVTCMPLVLQVSEVIDAVIDGPILKRFIGTFLGTIVMGAVDYFTQAQCGVFIVICTKFSPLWLAVFLVGLIMESAVLWAVFVRTTTSSSLRCLAPSTGLT